VQDADRMDALGAIGLARMFYTSGRMGRQLAHPDKPLGEGRRWMTVNTRSITSR
jgi:uncharacterized protein